MNIQIKILRGVSGSGKSTFAQSLGPNVTICSADDFFMKKGLYQFEKSKIHEAHEWCFEKFKRAIQNDGLVVVDNTNTTVQEMQRYVQVCVDNSIPFEIITIACPLEVAVARNVHQVNKKTIERQYGRFVHAKIPQEWPQTTISYIPTDIASLDGFDKVWVTSDTHLGHLNVIKYCSRPYHSVEEMNRHLTENFNNAIGPKDLLIHMGDFAMGAKELHAGYRAKLDFEIWLVKGNHDRSKTFCIETIKFDKVFDSLKFKYKGKTFFCQHVPPINSSEDFDLALCGHVHNEWKSIVDTKGRRIINVGVDIWDMKPVALDDILKMI